MVDDSMEVRLMALWFWLTHFDVLCAQVDDEPTTSARTVERPKKKSAVGADHAAQVRRRKSKTTETVAIPPGEIEVGPLQKPAADKVSSSDRRSGNRNTTFQGKQKVDQRPIDDGGAGEVSAFKRSCWNCTHC